jgi:hypothetical protein
MAASAKVAPPYSVVVISDSEPAELPKDMEDSCIASTSTCIVVGCRADVDGETEFVLGATSEVDPGSHPIFEGMLETPVASW